MADNAISSTVASAALIAGNAAIAKLTAADTSRIIAETSAKETSNTAAEDLEAINDQVAQMIEQTKLNNAGKVTSYEKETYDVSIDNNMTARDIGILRKNDSRLNLFSSLTKGDTVDVFKFRVTTTGYTKLGTLIADPEDKELLRIQIFSKSSGILIADRDPESGDAYENYQKLEAGTFELKQDEYAVRVSRMPGTDSLSQNEIQYVVQLSQGLYKNDFDTIEKGKSSSQDAYGFATTLANNADSLISGLSAASTFISSLPAIGTSATSKLTGALYDALF
ncbi:hypothetical protein [Dongia sp.]|uniref:hypothetical protein n=1 Tax=Dongia sp. TaxID=1977262 RepID=UPI0035B292A2